MQTFINIFTFIFVLGSIVFIHELGHFIAAKSFGVYCSEFSLGMGPSLFHFTKGETTYHIRALPIGGFVSMAGEADQEMGEFLKDVPFERTLKGIKTWQQVVIMAAGVCMNFILAIFILVSLNLTSGQIALNTNQIGGVIDGGVASQVGIEKDDYITDIYFVDIDQHYNITSMTDITNALLSSNNQLSGEFANAIITYQHDHQESKTDVVQLPYDSERAAYFIGIQVATRSLTFLESFKYAFSDFIEMSLMIFTTLGKLITDSKNTVSQLSGPAGIYQITSEVAQSKQVTSLFALIAMLSVNIGVFNLMPIPGLDGAQILFALVEKIMGKPLSTNVRYYLQLAGLILVFGLMIVVTIQDISRLF